MVTPCEFIIQQIGKAIEYPRNKKPPRMIMGMEITSSIVHTPKAINIEKMKRKKTHRLLITKFLIISPPFFIPLYHIFDNKSRRRPCVFNEIVLSTMKSSQARMKSSAFRLRWNEIRLSYPDEVGFRWKKHTLSWQTNVCFFLVREMSCVKKTIKNRF